MQWISDISHVYCHVVLDIMRNVTSGKQKGEWLDSVCLQTCEKTAPREMCQSRISKKRKPAVKTAVKTRRNVDRGNQLKGEGISNTFQQNTYSEAKQLYHSSIVTRENA